MSPRQTQERFERIDDRSAIVDSYVAHGVFVAAVVWALVAVVAPALAPKGAVLVALIAGVRLHFHPLRFRRLHRVMVAPGRVHVTPMFGRTRAVQIRAVEHDGHSPWPCTLLLEDGSRASFVARRDDGVGVLFDLHPSDRARYERPSDARDSLVELQLTSRAPAPSAAPGTARHGDRA